MTGDNVKFTPELREKLRKAYNKAKADGLDQFSFDGNDYVTRFAGYLLEYLDMKMPAN